MIEWHILNIPWNGILKDYAPSIVVFDGPPKFFFTHLLNYAVLLARRPVFDSHSADNLGRQ
jgi:hypothetical protein